MTGGPRLSPSNRWLLPGHERRCQAAVGRRARIALILWGVGGDGWMFSKLGGLLPSHLSSFPKEFRSLPVSWLVLNHMAIEMWEAPPRAQIMRTRRGEPRRSSPPCKDSNYCSSSPHVFLWVSFYQAGFSLTFCSFSDFYGGHILISILGIRNLFGS